MAVKLPFKVPQLPQLGPRTRKIVRALGYVVFALTVFVFALQATFPYQRVADKIVDALSEKFDDVKIGKVDRGFWPGNVHFENISFKTRPAQADLDRVNKIEDKKQREQAMGDLITPVFVNELDISLGVFALIRGKASVDFDARIVNGHIKGNVSVSKAGTTADITGRDLSGTTLPLKEAFSGLPLGGKVKFDFDLDLPNEVNKQGKLAPDWSKADGSLDFECPSSCTLGNGIAKFRPKIKNPKNEMMAKDGIAFGTVNIESFVAALEVKKGNLKVTKFDVQSKDLELKLQMDMTLQQELNESLVSGCARYKPTDTLAKREGNTFSAFMMIGGPLGPDTMYHVKLDGTFKDMGKKALVCSEGNQPMDDFSGKGKKSTTPSLSGIPQPTTNAGGGSGSGGIIARPAGSGSAGETNPPPPMMPRPPGPEHEGNGSGSGSAGSAGSGSAGSGSAGSAHEEKGERAGEGSAQPAPAGEGQPQGEQQPQVQPQ